MTQRLHDVVIELMADSLDHRYAVCTNPGAAKNCSVDGAWPDLVLTRLDSDDVVGVVEVETADSVTDHEAQRQWAVYGALRVPFTLCVPFGSRRRARQLLERYRIRAHLATFVLGHGGDVSFRGGIRTLV